MSTQNVVSSLGLICYLLAGPYKVQSIYYILSFVVALITLLLSVWHFWSHVAHVAMCKSHLNTICKSLISRSLLSSVFNRSSGRVCWELSISCVLEALLCIVAHFALMPHLIWLMTHPWSLISSPRWVFTHPYYLISYLCMCQFILRLIMLSLGFFLPGWTWRFYVNDLLCFVVFLQTIFSFLFLIFFSMFSY